MTPLPPRSLLLPPLLLLATTCVQQTQAWGQKSSFDNLGGALRLIREMLDDFGNGEPMVSPHEFFRLGVGLLGNHHMEGGIYADVPPANPVCNGDGGNIVEQRPQELDLAFSGGSHLNFTIALDPEYLREVQSRDRTPPTMNASEIFDRVFLRKDVMHPDEHLGLNFMWLTWVNFYFEDFLRTKPNTNGATRLDASTNMANLATVYGRTKERETILRAFEGGKMRTSINPYNNEEMALLWEDVEGATVPNATFPLLYVMGDDELNSHWGHIFWHTLYIKEHNRVATQLAASNPTFDDDRLYRMTRVIMTHRTARSFLENFASDVVLRALGVNARFPAAIEMCRDDEFADLRRRNTELPIEFLHAYVFHDLLPEDIDYGEGKTYSLAYDLFRKPDGYASSASFQEHADAFYRTPAGNASPQNIPPFLKFVTVLQIQQSWQNGLPSYTDYARYYGGPDYKTFEDLGHTEEVTNHLKEIYETVDDIDFYVGMLIEPDIFGVYRGDNVGFSLRTSLIAKYIIRNFLPVSCYPDPYLYTEEFLTAEGIEMIEGHTDAILDLLTHHVEMPDRTPLSREGFPAEFNYNEPKTMTTFRLRNMGDFVGLNEVWYAFATDVFPEYQYMYVAILVSAMIYVLLITIGGPYIKSYVRKLLIAQVPKDEDGKPKYAPNMDGIGALATHYFVMFAVLLVQMPVYTVIMIFILFSERPDYVFQTFWFAGWFMPSIHLVLYVADIAVRSRVPWFLAAHHVFWLLFFVMSPVFRDIFTMKVGLTLDYFVVWEGGLYWMLFWAKVNNREFSMRARFWGQICVWVYGISRLFQLPILIALFVRGWPRMKEFASIGLYFFALILTIGVQLSQAHVLYLFLGWEPVFGEYEDDSEYEDEEDDSEKIAVTNSSGSAAASGALGNGSKASVRSRSGHSKAMGDGSNHSKGMGNGSSHSFGMFGSGRIGRSGRSIRPSWKAASSRRFSQLLDDEPAVAPVVMAELHALDGSDSNNSPTDNEGNQADDLMQGSFANDLPDIAEGDGSEKEGSTSKDDKKEEDESAAFVVGAANPEPPAVEESAQPAAAVEESKDDSP